jgi:lysozyme
VPSNLRELITLHEDRVPHAYQDSLGYWTIGVGHLIDPRKGGRLPETLIDALLDYDIAEKKRELFAALPWVPYLDPVRQAVLVDMYFNLGPQFLKWKVTLGYVEAGRYREAAAEMRNSQPWASQVKTRAERLAVMMETGRWPQA